QNLELIISDDCSTDATVQICERWLKINNSRFKRVRLITSQINTGIAPNFNRGVAAAEGKWIKTIAGDDALFPYTIEKYISYISDHPDSMFLHSNIATYKDKFTEENRRPLKESNKYKINSKGVTADEQYEVLLRRCRVRAATVMIKKTVFNLVGNFDENYPLWEDRPMLLKIT
ncbi:glycosyltransferase family 2 protein, partial [Pontibacter rugosus]